MDRIPAALCFKPVSQTEGMVTRVLQSVPSTRDPDIVHVFISIMPISSLNSRFDHLLELSHRDRSNKWSNRIW